MTLAADVFSFLGPTGPLMAFGLIGIVMILLVVGINAFMRWQRSRLVPVEVDATSIEAAPSYRRFLVAAAWAGGSARDWDYSVRPVLGELVELAMAEHVPGVDPRSAAREVLGEQLWGLVDRDATRSDDRSVPGPGRDTLLTILDRVEGTT